MSNTKVELEHTTEPVQQFNVNSLLDDYSPALSLSVTVDQS